MERKKEKEKATPRISKICARRENVFVSCVPFGKGRPTGGGVVAVVACCPGSLAGLVDLLFDVLDGGVLGDTGLGLLVGHLSSCRGEVLVTLKKTQPVSPATDLDCSLVIGCSKRRNSI